MENPSLGVNQQWATGAQTRHAGFEWATHRMGDDFFEDVFFSYVSLFFSLGHFSLLFATFWSKNLYFAEFWS